MVSPARYFPWSAQRAGSATLLLLYVVACAALVASGATAARFIAIAAIVGPVLALIALKRPLLFPYAAYILAVPLENLLSVPGFGTLSRGLGIATGVALIIWIIRTRRIAPAGNAALFWFGLIAWELTSVMWTPDPALGLQHVARVFEAFALYALLSTAPIERRDLRIVLVAIVGGGVVASTYALWLAHANPAAVLAGRLVIGENAQYNDPNHVANALVAPTLLAVVGALALRGPMRLLPALAIVPLVLGIASTLSREAFVALGAGLLYLAVRSRFHRTLTAVVIAAVVAVLASPTLTARFAQGAADGGAGRTDIWRVGAHALMQHLPFGAGAGAFPNAYDAAYLEVSQHFAAGWDRAPHDLALQIGVEYGVVGLVVAFAAWFTTFRETARITTHDPRADLARAVEACIVALLVASTFIDLMEEKYVWLIFALAVQIRHCAFGSGVARPYANPSANPT